MLKKRVMTFLLVAAMSVGMLGGCASDSGTNTSTPSTGGSSSASDSSKSDSSTPAGNVAAKFDTTEKVTLTIGWLNGKSSADDEYWPTRVTEELMKTMNVELVATGYDEEKLNLDLAAGTLNDITMIYKQHVDGVVKGGHAEPMDAYLDKMPNLTADRMTYRNEIMRKYRSNGDNKLCFRTPQVTEEGNGEPVGAGIPYGHGVRWDLYKKIGMPDISTGEGWLKALKEMQKLEPKTAEGLPTYAFGAYNDIGLHTWIFRGLVALGMTQLDSTSLYMTDAVTNDFVSNIYNTSNETPFWADMKLYNQMYKEGLMDPDCFITKGEDVTSKYEKGQYLGGFVNWYWGKWNDKVQAADPNSIQGFEMIPTKMIWGGSQFKVGWDDKLYFVSAKSKQKERAMAVMDYLDSPEFSRLQFSGVEGEHWEKDANGVPKIMDSTIALKSDPAKSKEWNKVGIGATYTNMLGCAQGVTAADGYPTDLWQTPEILKLGLKSTDVDFCETYKVNYPNELALNLVKEGKAIDQGKVASSAKSLMPQPSKEISRIDGNILETTINAIPSLVQAADDKAFEAARAKLISSLKGAGVEDSVKWWGDTWKATLDEANKIG